MPTGVQLSGHVSNLPSSHLLRSNDPPRDSLEETAIRNFVADAECKLLHLDEDIVRLEAELELRRCQRQEVQCSIADHKAVLSSFRRLPREIISEIVLHALDRYTDQPLAVTLDTKTDPWVFGQICRTWRDVVLNLSQLWSVMEIGWEDPADVDKVYDIPNAKDITAAILQRSKQIPLDVIFRDVFTPDVSLRTFELVIRHCHRWKIVHLEMTIKNLLRLNEVKGKLHGLEAVHLSVNVDDGEDCTLTLDAFEFAPHMRRASTEINIERKINMALPWNQLTCYADGNAPISNRAQIASRLSNVVHCAFDSTFVEFRTPIVLPHLRLLNVEGPALDYVTASSLEKLRVRFLDDPTPLSSLIDRSRCSLTSLSIGPSNIENFVSLFKITPTLTTLRLWRVPYDHHLIHALTLKSTPDPPFLPNLQSLSLVVEANARQEHRVDGNALVQMVESRAVLLPEQHIARLIKFQFSLFVPRPKQRLAKEFMDRLTGLHAQFGIEVLVEARSHNYSIGGAFYGEHDVCDACA